jgi:hypothetical protein
MIYDKKTQADRILYTTAISKGAAMLEETRKLVNYWSSEETLDSFAKRVHEQGLLGNATAYRTKDIVKRVFATRYLKPNDRPAIILKNVLNSGLPLRTFYELVLLFSARTDPLLYDYTAHAYWPAVRQGRIMLDTDMVANFLSEAVLDGRLENIWSESVTVRIARCLLGFLRDIGYLRNRNRTSREIVNYRVTDETLAILARDLHEQGITDSALNEHPDWGLYGLMPNDVISRLETLGEHRGIIIQQTGAVIKITWRINSLEGLIDVLAGKSIQ